MNHITITGNLTKDPEKAATNNGVPLARFTVAVNQKRGTAAYYKVSAFGATGENCLKYISKGRKVMVIGDLEITEKDGKTYLNVSASNVEFLDKAQKDTFEDVHNEDIPF